MRSEVDVSLPDFRVSSSRSPMPSAFCVKRADAANPDLDRGFGRRPAQPCGLPDSGAEDCCARRKSCVTPERRTDGIARC